MTIVVIKAFGVVAVELEIQQPLAPQDWEALTKKWEKLILRFDVQWRTLPPADRVWAALGFVERAIHLLRDSGVRIEKH